MTEEDESQKQHYVNNADFFKHMKSHIAKVKKAKKAKKPLPQVSDFIGECIVSIANKLANKPNFMNYPFREEMISDGIENSLQYLNNFNPSKSSNPFAYFTQIIYYAFVRRIQKEKKHLYTKYTLIRLHHIPNSHKNIKNNWDICNRCYTYRSKYNRLDSKTANYR